MQAARLNKCLMSEVLFSALCHLSARGATVHHVWDPRLHPERQTLPVNDYLGYNRECSHFWSQWFLHSTSNSSKEMIACLLLLKDNSNWRSCFVSIIPAATYSKAGESDLSLKCPRYYFFKRSDGIFVSWHHRPMIAAVITWPLVTRLSNTEARQTIFHISPSKQLRFQVRQFISTWLSTVCCSQSCTSVTQDLMILCVHRNQIWAARVARLFGSNL